MGNFYVFEYDIKTGHMSNTYGKLIPEEEQTLDAFVKRLDPAMQQDFMRHTQVLMNGEEQDRYFKRRYNIGTEEAPDWRHLEGTAIVEQENHKPRYLVYAVKDITQDVESERINQEIGNKYARMFETNLIAMSFYDKEGWFVDANEKMRDLCGFDDKGYEFFRSTNMFDTSMLVNIYEKGSREPLHICSHMYYPEMDIDRYIELRIRPILDEQGELFFYVITSRDITAERTMYLEKMHHDIEIRKTYDAINIYEQQLTYLLENSEMFVWRYNLQERTLSYSRSLRKPEFEETIDEYNEMCESSDTLFYKPQKFMKPIEKGPFYAGLFRPGAYGTLGGIKIDENAQVLTADWEKIPGLYAAGTDTCTIYGDSYMFLLPGNTMGYCINTGRFAGSAAAEYAQD
jgi:PAS domain-containing protein